MITLSPKHAAERAAAALSATLAKLNSGLANATLSAYGTLRPESGASTGASPLVVCTLAKPAGSIDNGILTLVPVEAMILVTGVALWARFSVDDDYILDCDVSDANGTATIRLATTQLYAGGLVRLASGIIQ